MYISKSFYFYLKDFLYNKSIEKTPGKDERRDADGYQSDFLPFSGSGADALSDPDIDYSRKAEEAV